MRDALDSSLLVKIPWISLFSGDAFWPAASRLTSGLGGVAEAEVTGTKDSGLTGAVVVVVDRTDEGTSFEEVSGVFWLEVADATEEEAEVTSFGSTGFWLEVADATGEEAEVTDFGSGGFWLKVADGTGEETDWTSFGSGGFWLEVSDASGEETLVPSLESDGFWL